MIMFCLILAGEIIFSLPFHVIRYFRPVFISVFQVSNSQLGDAMAFYGILAMLAYFPSGLIADRFPARGLMTVSLLVTSLGGVWLSFVPERRVKEIGVRKVNGAKLTEVLFLLNKDFAKWVLIAFVFATPVSWYIMNNWMQNFAYKTNLSWWVFAASGVMALLIALLTVSWQSWKTATRNPLEALRYE